MTEWEKLCKEYEKWLVQQMYNPDQPSMRAYFAMKTEGDKLQEKAENIENEWIEASILLSRKMLEHQTHARYHIKKSEELQQKLEAIQDWKNKWWEANDPEASKALMEILDNPKKQNEKTVS